MLVSGSSYRFFMAFRIGILTAILRSQDKLPQDGGYLHQSPLKGSFLIFSSRQFVQKTVLKKADLFCISCVAFLT